MNKRQQQQRDYYVRNRERCIARQCAYQKRKREERRAILGLSPIIRLYAGKPQIYPQAIVRVPVKGWGWRC